MPIVVLSRMDKAVANKVQDIGPLTFNVSIVDGNGRPSPEFQRRWNTQRNNNGLIGSITLGKGPPTGKPDDGAEYVDITTTPYTLYVGSDGAWHLIGPLAADPTAIAGDVAVDGTATTFMRSDSAPAVQKASDSQFGIVEVDGFTILADTGVISTGGSFRFFIGSPPTANEELGSGNWGHDVSFDNGQPGSIITSLLPAASTAVLHIKTIVSGVLTEVGTITFAAAGKVGTLNWIAPITITAGTPISLWGPSPSDATLGNITGVVQGQ